ncbi:MAG: helix-turn-helix domain-containing protein [Bdellovibrionales bacterium]|nr:helix-turn-helix domain-containing protein [Bdellovibrionales bacterium]
MKLTGQILKEARERAGVSLNEVSFSTKISLKVLQSIEEGDHDRLPPKAFLRGFVRSYAEYLRLDVQSIMNQFQEEMGSTKPLDASIPNQTPPPPGTSFDKEVNQTQRRFPVAKAALVVLILALIQGVLSVQKMLSRYQEEKVTEPVTVTSAEDEKMNSMTPEPLPAPSQTSESPDALEIVPSTTSTTNFMIVGKNPTSTSSSSTSSTTTALATTTTSKPVVTTTTTKTPVTTTTTKPPATTTTTTKPPVTTTTQGAAAAAAPSPSTTTTTVPGKGPQELIIEALDSVQIKYQVDDGPSKTASLNPDQFLTIKAKAKLSVEFSDGAAVSLIQNGRDRGVPGTLGQPKRMSFP